MTLFLLHCSCCIVPVALFLLHCSCCIVPALYLLLFRSRLISFTGIPGKRDLPAPGHLHITSSQAAQLHSCVQSWHAAAGCLMSLSSTFLDAMSDVSDARVSSAGALQDLQTEWQQ